MIPTIGREQTVALENAIRECLEPVNCPVEEYWIDGVYFRAMHIPAGTALVSKVHRFECMSIVSRGRISVAHDGPPEIYEAGAHIHSPPGTKRSALALENTIWTTIHKNADNERDATKLEAKFIVSPEESESCLLER